MLYSCTHMVTVAVDMHCIDIMLDIVCISIKMYAIYGYACGY